MAALPTRILWLLRDQGGPLMRRSIVNHFAAYKKASVIEAIERLHDHGLVTATRGQCVDPDLCRYALTDLGRAQAVSTNAPRWAAAHRAR